MDSIYFSFIANNSYTKRCYGWKNPKNEKNMLNKNSWYIKFQIKRTNCYATVRISVCRYWMLPALSHKRR